MLSELIRNLLIFDYGDDTSSSHMLWFPIEYIRLESTRIADIYAFESHPIYEKKT